MKTIGRFFLLTATAAMLFSCSATGFNIFGKAPVDSSGIIDSISKANESASDISTVGSIDSDGNFTIKIGDSSITITDTDLSAGDSIYGPDTEVPSDLAMILETDGGGVELVEELAQEALTEKDSNTLKNTSKLYSSIINKAVNEIDLSGYPEIASSIEDIQKGLTELSTSESLTQADAILVQSLTSVTYTLLEVAGNLEEDSSLSDIPQNQVQSILEDVGLVTTYSQAVSDSTYDNSLATAFVGLYDSLLSMMGGNAQ